MKWFGTPWPQDWEANGRAPVCEDDEDHMPTPVENKCLYCGEPIQADDQGVIIPGIRANGELEFDPVHRICILKWTGIYSIVEGHDQTT